MIEWKTGSEAYWRTEFTVTDQDLEQLGLLFLESERPLSISELTRSLIANRCHQEENTVRRQLSKGTLYRPDKVFTVGQTLVFPQYDFAVATVVDQRDGHNPEYGDFKVISVEFEDDAKDRARAYAAELQVPHKLSLAEEESTDDLLSVSSDELYDRFGALVSAKLTARLQSSTAYVSFRGQWLLDVMLADVHVGYLNIAEAMVDISGEPLKPEQLLVELDLPEEISPTVQVFSLNRALSRDDRFDDVGDTSEILWSLRRWEPEEVTAIPSRLMYSAVPYDRTSLDVAHLQMERELDDSASDLVASPVNADTNSVTLLLGYTYWRTGTIPLTARTRSFFPTGSPEQHTLITFLDRANRREFPGWVIHSHGYVYGLEEWYRQNDIPVGAYIRLEREDDPRRLIIDFLPRRMQREWVRLAFQSPGGELAFQMQKLPIACEYDELCLMGDLDPAVVDRLWEQEQGRGRPLRDVAIAVFLELVKMSPSGVVHAKTLYNGLNVIRRTPPGPLFATLFNVPQFVTTGDGYWAFHESLGGS